MLIVVTLTQIPLNFNRKIMLSNDGGDLSSDSGLLVFREFDATLRFSDTINQFLCLKDDRLYYTHSNENLLRQKLYQMIAGYFQDDAADDLTRDSVFTELLGTEALASQPSLSRFYDRFDVDSVTQLNDANQVLLDRVHRHRQSDALIFDLDSTHADTYGQQEQTAYNTQYGITGDCLKAELRPGNVYTSNGMVDFIRPLITHYNTQFPETTPFLRGDSGFAVPALYDLCEDESVSYVIRLKSYSNLQKIADEVCPAGLPGTQAEKEYIFTETEYAAKSWRTPRKVIIQSVRAADELFFTHSFFVTNLVDATPETIVRSYQKRGTMENYIKESKYSFGFDRMNSPSFLENQVRMQFSVLAYNLTNWLRTLCFPKEKQTMQMGTIRTRIIKVASKVVRSGRRLHFKLASSFVYASFFWNVLKRVQTLQIE